MITRLAFLSVVIAVVICFLGCVSSRNDAVTRQVCSGAVPASHDEIAQQVPVFPVLVIDRPGSSEYSSGAGLLLSDCRLLLSLHQIWDENRKEPMQSGWMRIGPGSSRYTLLSTGGELGTGRDWAVVQLETPLASSVLPIETDFTSPLQPGTEVFIVAYEFNLAGDHVPTNPDNLQKRAIRGWVISPPGGYDLPQDTLFIDSEAKDSVFRASGGSVVTRDPGSGRIVAIGTTAALIWPSGMTPDHYIGIAVSRMR